MLWKLAADSSAGPTPSYLHRYGGVRILGLPGVSWRRALGRFRRSLENARGQIRGRFAVTPRG